MNSKLMSKRLRIVIASVCFGCVTYSGTAHTQTIVDVPVRLKEAKEELQQPLRNGHYYRPAARVLRAMPIIHVYVFDDFENKERWIVLNMHWTDQAGRLRNDLNFPILQLLVLPVRKEWAPNLAWHRSTGTSALISTELLLKHMPAGLARLRQYLDVVKPFPITKEK